MANEVFKECPSCGVQFTLRDILESSDIEPIGLTYEKRERDANMFYFNHKVDGCGTTFLVPVDKLASQTTPPRFENILEGTSDCEEHCSNIDDWQACGQPCFYAPFRRLLISMLERRQMVAKPV